MKQLSRQEIYNGKIIKVYNDKVELENGNTTYREVVAHREAVAAVALTEDNELLMVTQYRYPIHKSLTELPAGLIDEGETPLEAVKRELKEETGYEAERWQILASPYTSPGSHNERIHIYAALGLRKVSGQDLDKDEILTFEAIPYEDVLNNVKTGKITDAKTIIGVLLFEAKKNK